MSEDVDHGAEQEAERLIKEFGEEAPLYAALRAQRAIEQRDYRRCAHWKYVLEILDEEHRQNKDLPRH